MSETTENAATVIPATTIPEPISAPSDGAPTPIPAKEIDQPADADQVSLVAEMFSQDFNSDVDPGMLSTEASPSPVPAEVTSAPVVPVATPAPVEPAAVTPPPVQPVPPVDAAAKVDPAVAPPASSEAAQPPAAQPDNVIDALRAEVDKNRDTYISALAGSVYKLSDVELDEISTDPGASIPKLIAKSHVNIAQNILGVIAQQLPTMVRGIQAAEQQHKTLEDGFFTKWPQLDRNTDRAAVLQAARVFRQMNPSADYNTMVNMVGAQVAVALGKYQAPVAVAPTPAQVPFRPAANGSGGPAAPSPSDNNPFAAMADAMLLDD